MSIADKISALQTAKSDIATAITAKGGTVSAGDGFADFAADIGTISGGGGGGVTGEIPILTVPIPIPTITENEV